MSSQDRGVSGEVVEVVHDDSHEQVENEEATDDEETDEVEISKVVAAPVTIWI